MKTWKTKRTVCRSRRSGKFVPKALCKAFKRQLVRPAFKGVLFGK